MALTEFLGVAGFFFAIASFLTTFLHGRHVNKRDLLIKIHDQMTSIENQQGRKILIDLDKKNESIDTLSDDQHALANKALSTIDIMGFYCEKRYIKRKVVLDLWAPSLRRLSGKAEEFMSKLDKEKDRTTWPHCRNLINAAKNKAA